MGADGSRLYSPAEESIDAYIDRGGARLVNRERSFTTSTTVDVGSGGNYTFRNVRSFTTISWLRIYCHVRCFTPPPPMPIPCIYVQYTVWVLCDCSTHKHCLSVRLCAVVWPVPRAMGKGKNYVW